MKRALILDLDNTIYPVSSIAEHLFGKLFKLIDDSLEDRSAAAAAKLELTRRPYQHVADEFGFSPELKENGVKLLNNLTFDSPMQTFNEYEDIRAINIDKYLVTTGFTKLQMSKVKMLNIEADFKQVYVVDPDLSNQTKKDIFEMIIKDNGYAIDEVVVIGDDPQSEIKAALELGIDTFLFDPENKYPHANVTHRGTDYKGLAEIIQK
jgi:putative hydrolase of the HAD superfamily